jgi:hypothetical protein
MATTFSFILFLIAIIILVVICVIVYRLAVTAAIARSSLNPNSAVAKNGKLIENIDCIELNNNKWNNRNTHKNY